MKNTILASILVLAATLLAACRENGHAQEGSALGDVTRAVAVVHPTEGNQAHGTVRLTHQGDGKVKVVAEMAGLTPGVRHAIHVHEYGDCSAADGTSAGGHYNPEGHEHGLPEQGERHAGDWGNLPEADEEGRARLELVVDNLTIAGARNPVLGRAVIVHAEPDDGSQPTGAAGARIGCGVIGIANPGQ